MNKKSAVIISLIVAIVLLAIFLQNIQTKDQTKGPLVCHVGGTMKPVMQEFATSYELKTGQKVEINSAGSGELLAHIALQKRGDVYVCHDPFIDILMEKYQMGVDGWLVAEITPVIVVAKGNPKKVRSVADLTREDVELILTDYKGSSLGRMLSTIFAKAGIDFEKLNEEKKIHTNRSGGYAANFVMTGNADASMVWNAVAHLRRDKLDIVRIDDYLPEPNVDAVTSATGISYILTPMRVTIATLTCSKQPKQAQKFAEFIASQEAQKVFKDFGFTDTGSTKLYADGKDLGTSTKRTGAISTKTEQTIKIYAGAGLRRAIDKLAEAFEQDTGIKVEPDYGGSGHILSRVQMNEDGDLFMPGDVSWVRMLHDRTGWVQEETTISYFVPVIIVQKGNPKNINSITDFFRRDVVVGLGRDQACQVGKASNKILAAHGYAREGLDLKESLTVNEIGVWVKMNDVDTGIVWDAIYANIADSADKIDIPKDKNDISRVVVGLLSHSKNKPAAQAFTNFLVSEQGKAILSENGFSTEAPY
jgi:molybdate transport system substrate-binding protein